VDYIDESEVLTPADPFAHVNKNDFKVPFVCGATNLGEALRRINEGACMIRTKGEAGTGNVIEAVRHWKVIQSQIESLKSKSEKELIELAKEMRVPIELVHETNKLGRLTVVNFAAGGIATPADAAMMMQLGCDGVFVGSGIFKSENPKKMAKAIVDATMNFNKPDILAKVSEDLGSAMDSLTIESLDVKLAERGL
jgi:pyridoxal 5'-phosphate synthase pdxS subunit